MRERKSKIGDAEEWRVEMFGKSERRGTKSLQQPPTCKSIMPVHLHNGIKLIRGQLPSARWTLRELVKQSYVTHSTVKQNCLSWYSELFEAFNLGLIKH